MQSRQSMRMMLTLCNHLPGRSDVLSAFSQRLRHHKGCMVAWGEGLLVD